MPSPPVKRRDVRHCALSSCFAMFVSTSSEFYFKLLSEHALDIQQHKLHCLFIIMLGTVMNFPYAGFVVETYRCFFWRSSNDVKALNTQLTAHTCTAAVDLTLLVVFAQTASDEVDPVVLHSRQCASKYSARPLCNVRCWVKLHQSAVLLVVDRVVLEKC